MAWRIVRRTPTASAASSSSCIISAAAAAASSAMIAKKNLRKNFRDEICGSQQLSHPRLRMNAEQTSHMAWLKRELAAADERVAMLRLLIANLMKTVPKKKMLGSSSSSARGGGAHSAMEREHDAILRVSGLRDLQHSYRSIGAAQTIFPPTSSGHYTHQPHHQQQRRLPRDRASMAHRFLPPGLDDDDEMTSSRRQQQLQHVMCRMSAMESAVGVPAAVARNAHIPAPSWLPPARRARPDEHVRQSSPIKRILEETVAAVAASSSSKHQSSSPSPRKAQKISSVKEPTFPFTFPEDGQGAPSHHQAVPTPGSSKSESSVLFQTDPGEEDVAVEEDEVTSGSSEAGGNGGEVGGLTFVDEEDEEDDDDEEEEEDDHHYVHGDDAWQLLEVNMSSALGLDSPTTS
jgi:hypothetical protein